MHDRLKMLGTFVVLAAIIGFLGTRPVPGAAEPAAALAAKPVEVRWLLAHQPTDLFLRAATVFAAELSKDSGGTMSLTVVLPQDLGYQGDVPTADVLNLLQTGKAELGSTYVVGLGMQDPQINVMNLPFLFSDYASAAKVLDSDVGKQILATVGEHTSARALAFTYSGGFRVIVSNTPIRSAKDFKGLHIATAGGPVAEETLKELGATPIPVVIGASGAPAEAADADAVETTYTRLSGVLGNPPFKFKYIDETNHSLFLTAIIADKSFYDSLSASEQGALAQAAQAAAATERADSIALAEKTRTDIQQEGATVVPFSAAATADLKARLQSVYQKFEPLFGAGLVQDIIDQQ